MVAKSKGLIKQYIPQKKKKKLIAKPAKEENVKPAKT